MGRALQAALDAVEQRTDAADESALVIAAKVRALMCGYDARWSPDPSDGDRWVPIELERTSVLPLVNPSTGRASRTWRHAGKRDGIIRGFGKTVLYEAKSTSENVQDPNDPYWRRLAIDAQVSHYMLEAWQEEMRLDGTLYDVIRKPSIRPKTLATKDQKEVMGVGTYCGVAISEETRLDVATGAVKYETAELYAVRLAVDTLARPDHYYQRRQVPRLDSDLADYAHELWEVGEAIRHTRVAARGERNPWYRNPAACMTYGRVCPYLPLCAGYDSVESDRWVRREHVHRELDGIDGDGRDVLTHSRIATWQTCRRRHYWQYELGIERLDAEGGEALALGTLLHVALRAWWSEQRQEGGLDDQSSSAGAPPEGATVAAAVASA